MAIPFGNIEDGILCRQVTHDQIVIPHDPKRRDLHIHYNASLARHPDAKKLNQSIRKDVYWTALTVDFYVTVRRCPTCAKNRIRLYENIRWLQLFRITAPPELVAIDVLDELVKAARGTQYLLILSDRFPKLTKSVHLKSVFVSYGAKTFVHKWIFDYGTSKNFHANNGKCFTAKYFQNVSRIMNIYNRFTLTYHPQTNEQVERFNRILQAAICSYHGDHPTDWDFFIRHFKLWVRFRPAHTDNVRTFCTRTFNTTATFGTKETLKIVVSTAGGEQ